MSSVRYVFFRLKETQPDKVRRRFMNSQWLRSHGDWPPNPEHYASLYHCSEDFPRSYCTNEVLEAIFCKYNGEGLPKYFRPKYFHEEYELNWPSGADYSLSVGDIVVLVDTYPREDLQEGAYFCDSMGFAFLGMRLSKEFLDRT